MSGDTVKYDIKKARSEEIRTVLKLVYEALNEAGYDSMGQMVGYILSEDPGYITNHKNARSLMRKIDRDEILHELLAYYLGEEK